MNTKNSSKCNVKKRHWTFVLYPESAPSDWRDILQKTGLQVCISPLHDKDINPTGEVKKAHYHLILCYSGPTSYNVVKSITDRLNQPIPQPIEQVRGVYRYLTHKDNPEKYQYSDCDISVLNGFNIIDYSDYTRSEIEAYKRFVLSYIRDNDILEYSDLLDALYDSALFDELSIASSNTLLFNSYIRSRRHQRNGSCSDD